MYLSNAETCSRGEAFDQIVEQTGRALRSPEVAQIIGQSLTTELLELHSQLFLPDVRDGVALLSDGQKNKAAPALLPITAQEVPALHDMTDELMDSFIRHWPLGVMRAAGYARIASATYGIEADIDDVEFWMKNPPPVKKYDTNEGPGHPLTVTCTNAKLDKDRLSVARPIIVMQYDRLFQYPDEVPSGTAHELVHARDVLQDGPLMVSEAHTIASEYCAYHVDHAIGTVVGHARDTENLLPGIVETFRKEHADPERPFAPTLEMIIKAHELGIV